MFGAIFQLTTTSKSFYDAMTVFLYLSRSWQSKTVQ